MAYMHRQFATYVSRRKLTETDLDSEAAVCMSKNHTTATAAAF